MTQNVNLFLIFESLNPEKAVTAQEFQPKDWMSQVYRTFREIWLDVVGLEDYAMVSQYGRVYLKKYDRITEGYMSTSKGNPYMYVSINRRMYGIHRLVCLTFRANPEHKPEVNHLDGVQWNNNLLNLEHATFSENRLHAFRILKRNRRPSKLTHETKDTIRSEYGTGMYTQSHLAVKYGVARSHISKVTLNLR